MLVLDAKGLVLDATLDCGQCFRWKRQPDGGWVGVVEGRAVRADHGPGDALRLEGLAGPAPESEPAFWERYFALDLDYPALQGRMRAANRKLAACIDCAPGIRVLRQPFFEALVTFLISQNNNIPRIKGIVDRLCQGLGAAAGRAAVRLPRRGGHRGPHRGGAGLPAGGVARRLHPGGGPAHSRRRPRPGGPARAAPGRGPRRAAAAARGRPQGGGLRPAVRPGPVGRLPGGRLDGAGAPRPLHRAGQGPRRLPQPADGRLRRHRAAIHFRLGAGGRPDRKNAQKTCRMIDFAALFGYTGKAGACPHGRAS